MCVILKYNCIYIYILYIIYIYIYIYIIYIIYLYILSVNLLILFRKDALPLVHLGQTFPRSDEIKLLKFIFNI